MSTQGNWYSAMVRVVSIVTEDSKESPGLVFRSVFVFKCDSDDNAVLKARELGLAEEYSTINGFGNPLKHRFVRVESLDRLDVELSESGREVWAEIIDATESDLVPSNPNDSPPGTSGVLPGDPWDE